MGNVIDFNKAKANVRKRQADKPREIEFIESGLHALVVAIREQKNLIVVPCTDMLTNKTVMVLCTPLEIEGGKHVIVPLAQLFESNPLDFLKPVEGIVTGAI